MRYDIYIYIYIVRRQRVKWNVGCACADGFPVSNEGPEDFCYKLQYVHLGWGVTCEEG